MSFRPVISPEIFARHPDFHLLSLVVHNAGVTVPESLALAEAIGAAEQSASLADSRRDAHLAAWGEAYRGFGAKPNRTPCSAAALLKRVSKDGALPRISPLVDAYNAISVLHGVPVGGEDLDLYKGLPRLKIATGDEAFETVLQGEPVTEHPEPGEVVWCDDAGVTCRRWNWRQGRRTMVTASSRSLWLVLEALGPLSSEGLQTAGTQLASVIRSLCPKADIDLLGLDALTPA